MTTWTHRTIIVPDAVVIPARLACEAIARGKIRPLSAAELVEYAA